MEPHENKKIDLSKAVAAHEQAEAALSDLILAAPSPRYEQMLERVQRNLEELRAETAKSAP